MEAYRIQEAFEKLVCRGQDRDTVNEIFSSVLKPAGTINVKIVRPDHDAIQMGPVIQDDDTFITLVTVQVEISVGS